MNSLQAKSMFKGKAVILHIQDTNMSGEKSSDICLMLWKPGTVQITFPGEFIGEVWLWKNLRLSRRVNTRNGWKWKANSVI